MEYHTAVKITKLKLTGNKRNSTNSFLEIYKESKEMMNVELNIIGIDWWSWQYGTS